MPITFDETISKDGDSVMDVREKFNTPPLSARSRTRAIDEHPQDADANSGGNNRGEVNADNEEQHSPAPEIVELTIRLEDFPESRKEVVNDARQQLQNGTYFTRESAEQLALILVGDQT